MAETSDFRTNETLAVLIRSRLGTMTSTERRAAHVLLAHYPFAGLETVALFAHRAGVSAPSILRFVSKLGFSAYPDFQRHLREELEAQLQSPLMKAGPSPTGAVFGDFAEAVLANVRRPFETMAPDEFEAVLSLLVDIKRELHMVGGRFTEAIATYMARHLRVVRPGVTAIEGQPATWHDQVIEFGKRDVLVVFDIRRYQDDVVLLAQEAAERGATIILFTDQWLSPVARVARHVISARVAAPSNWDSNVAILAVVEALIASATKKLGGIAEARMKALEDLRRRGRERS